MNNDNMRLNILYGLADDLEEGLTLMMRNPLFANVNYQKLISFALYSVESVQIYLRLEQSPLTINGTTILNVYQTNSPDTHLSHAFLSLDEFYRIGEALFPDVCESLTRLNNGSVVQFDLNNSENVIRFLDQLIQKAEAELVMFLYSTSKLIYHIAYSIIKALFTLISNDFTAIQEVVNAILDAPQPNINEPNNDNDKHPELISFIRRHSQEIQECILKAIQNNIIPDFAPNQLAELQRNVTDLKQLKQNIFLACEIHRRRNSMHNIHTFKIDLEIVQDEDSVQKYNVHLII